MNIEGQDLRFDEVARHVVMLDRKLRPSAKERARNMVPKGKSHACTRAVFDAILDRINMTETGFWTLSYKQLEQATGYQRRQIMRVVKFLRFAGLLMVRAKFTADGDRDRNDYTIPVLIGVPLPPVEQEGGNDMGVTRCGDVDGITCGDTGVTLSTCESGTRESGTLERSSIKPGISESGAARAQSQEEQQDDDRADLCTQKPQAPEVIPVEAAKWLCDVTGLPPGKIVQRALDVGVGFARYGEAILKTRPRYNSGAVKHDYLLSYIDETARNLAKGARPHSSAMVRPPLRFKPASAMRPGIAADPDGDLLTESEIFMSVRRPIAATASLRNSGLVKG